MSNRISTPINSWYKLRASTQAMSETAADAAAIPGNTGEPRQSSLFYRVVSKLLTVVYCFQLPLLIVSSASR